MKKKSSVRGRITFYFTILIGLIIFGIILCIGIMIANGFVAQKKALIAESVDIILNAAEERINAFRFVANEMRENTTQELIMQKESSIYGLQKLFKLDAFGNPITDELVDFSDIEVMCETIGLDRFFISNREELFSLPHNYSALPQSSENANRITYMKRLRSRNNYETTGYVVMNLNSSVIFGDKLDYIERLFSNFYVIDKEGNIIFKFGEKDAVLQQLATEMAQKPESKALSWAYQNGQVIKTNLPSYPEWSIVGYVPERVLQSETKNIISAIVLIGIFGLLMVFVFANIISRKITKPISDIKLAMQMFQTGEMPPKLVAETNDELGFLVAGFNSMVEDIDTYIETIFKEQEEKEKAEIYAVKYQLESLQSQINPHFLYNTLNTVKYLASVNQTQQIAHLIVSLNKLLRSTLSNNDDEVLISKELEFLEAYINIQSYRFPDMVELQMDVQEEVLGYKIPKLILQPIIENAVLHGIFPTGKPGKVILEIFEQENRIMVRVTDRGVGMEQTTFSQLKKDKKQFSGIGLLNVNERLILLYGEESALHLQSTIGEGTTFWFSIPIG